MDSLFVSIELFSLGVTIETLRSSEYWLEIGVFEGGLSVSAKL